MRKGMVMDMKKVFQKAGRKILAVVCLMAMAASLPAFTFAPTEKPAARATLAVGEDGKLQLENMSVTRTDWYPEVREAEGKKGLASAMGWQSPLMMLIDTNVFQGITDIRVTVEWFDANHNRENNAEKCARFYYVPSGGTVKEQKWLNSYQKTNAWTTSTYELKGVDLTQTNIIRPGYAENLELLPDHIETVADGVDAYYGLLVHSVTVEAMETYSIKQLDVMKSAVWSADGTGEDIAWQIKSGAKEDTPVRTITDTAGVTMTGKASAIETPKTDRDKEALFVVDTEKYRDVKACNVAITYWDALGYQSASDRAIINLRWIREDGNGTWGAVDQTGAKYLTGDGKWKTMIFTLPSIDFTKTNIVSGIPANLQIYTMSPFCNAGTEEDTSDDFYGLLIAKVEVTPISEYTFTDLRFTDGENRELSALPANSAFYTDLTVIRTGGGEAAELTLITALFDEASGVLENIAYETRRIEKDSRAAFQTCFTTPEDVSGKCVKLMLWNSMQGMIPIANPLLCK